MRELRTRRADVRRGVDFPRGLHRMVCGTHEPRACVPARPSPICTTMRQSGIRRNLATRRSFIIFRGVADICGVKTTIRDRTVQVSSTSVSHSVAIPSWEAFRFEDPPKRGSDTFPRIAPDPAIVYVYVGIRNGRLRNLRGTPRFSIGPNSCLVRFSAPLYAYEAISDRFLAAITLNLDYIRSNMDLITFFLWSYFPRSRVLYM